jgi:hypothetical protein
MTREVITIKTSDISHLRASLPSWQNALLRAIRDVEIFKLSRSISALMGEDLVMLPVWPCAFFNDFYLTVILGINALISIFKFVMIFLFRKTALIFGGPGPAKQVSFLPDEKPELLLRSVANDVTTAQRAFSWANPFGSATLTSSAAVGSAKSIPSPVSSSEAV